jgi:hypothetical protein
MPVEIINQPAIKNINHNNKEEIIMSAFKLKNSVLALTVLSVFAFSSDTFSQSKGSTTKAGGNKTTLQRGSRFVDANGDGICDNAKDTNGDGIPDGKGQKGTRPMDGTGKKNKLGNGHGHSLMGGGQGSGTGVCDGTGPKGNGAKK